MVKNPDNFEGMAELVDTSKPSKFVSLEEVMEADARIAKGKVVDLSEKAFADYAIGQVSMIMDLLKRKGDQYSGASNNALINFLEGSKVVGQTPANYLMAIATKHWHSLALWSLGKSNKPVGEICERAKDIVVYMLLLMWMAETHQEK